MLINKFSNRLNSEIVHYGPIIFTHYKLLSVLPIYLKI